MKKVKLLLTSPEQIVFVDSKDEESIYCMSRETCNYKNAVTERYDRKEKNVPDEFTIPVFRVEKISEKDSFTDEYDIKSNIPIDFPINRIHWILIQHVPQV